VDVVVAEPEVFALVFAAAELSPGAVVFLVAEPEVVFVVAVDLGVSEPGIFFVVVVSIAHVAEPQASGDIAAAIAVLVPVSVVVAEVDSSGHPTKFLAFPNVDYFASSASSVEVVGKESVHNSTDARTNDDLCSVLSNLGLHQNKNLECYYNKPSLGYKNVNDTNDLPIDATTNLSRKRDLHQYQGQRRHTSQVSLLTLVVREKQWAEEEEN
jgi:hypothetical protein